MASQNLFLDFETFSAADIKGAGSFKYMEDPDFHILLLAYAFNDDPVTVVDFTSGEPWPKDFMTALTDPEVTKIAHNAAFERYAILKALGVYCPPEQWFDTMHLVAQCGLPTSLDAAGKALGLGEDTAKMKEGKALIKYFCCPCKPTKTNGGRTRNLPEHASEKWEIFKDYCERDVVAERELYNLLAPHWMPNDEERRFWALDARINENGVRIDTTLAANAVVMDQRYKEELTAKAIELTGMENPKSVSQIKKWLFEQEGQEITSLNKKVIADVVAGLKTDAAKEFMKIRAELAKSSTAKYEAMMRVTCPDGHAKGCFQFYGANRTGRFSGKHIQFQNLSKNEMPDIGLAREMVRSGDYEGVKLLFGSVSKTLSELVRTAIIPEDGHQILVADFSAIEARVIAWIAGEEWRLKVFEDGGDIYCSSASQMFKVPVEKHGVNGHLRQKGKVAELACGFGGGVNALKAFGADKMGLSNEEMAQIVDQWRAASPNIVALWKSLERAAIRAVVHRCTTISTVGKIRFQYEKGVLWMTLPSGRRIAYWGAEYGPSKWNPDRKSLSYMGVDQKTKKWSRVETFGGKLTENCWAAGTPVLTDEGWVPIERVTASMRVWDGVEWVGQNGSARRTHEEPLFELDGLLVTGTHEILTTEGWVIAKECDGLDRLPVQLPNGVRPNGDERLTWEAPMACEMRVRENLGTGLAGLEETCKRREADFLRLQKRGSDFGSTKDPRHDEAPGLWRVAQHGAALHGTHAQGLEELRRSGHYGLRQMAAQLRELLGGHGAYLRAWVGFGSRKQQFGLLARELPLGDKKRELPKQAWRENGLVCRKGTTCERNLRDDRNRVYDTPVSAGSRLSVRATDRRTGCHQPVYDVLNCGPRHRYVVLGATGPVIAHNCVQATARDCLRESMFALDNAGYDIRATVHDEVIVTEPLGGRSVEEMAELMGHPIEWAPGLPLRADGYSCPFYIKD